MKMKLTAVATSVMLAFSIQGFANEQVDVEEMAEDIEFLQEQLRELQIKSGGANLKFNADYRVTMDSLEYKMSDGSTVKNDALFSNRLEIGMGYQPFENLIFTGLLSYNKAFGENDFNDSGMGQYDWVVNENINENVLRVKEVGFLYLGDNFFGSELDWTGSIGRRPSTNGFIANNREGYDKAKSPLGHSINVEFDGFSLGVKLEDLTGVDGMAAKICGGRGVSETGYGRFSSTSTDYASADALDNVDMLGIIFTPYNDGQYDIRMQYYYAVNMLDQDWSTVNFSSTGEALNDPTKMTQVGDLQNLTFSMQVNGIGEFINDFLDDTVLFASTSMSQTLPDNNNSSGFMGSNQGMLGSTDKEIGYSFWLGATFPGFMDKDRFGLEYNHGSKYWRSFTYGEDTLIGSKIAARGNAYEVYYNVPLISDAFYLQLRYTYIDYQHQGSNGFFGASGDPDGLGYAYVESAQDIRAMIRYNY